MECSEITRLVRGVFNTRPHQRVLFPTWILVLDALSKAQFELLLEVSVKFVTCKHYFLLLLCPGRVMQWFGSVRAEATVFQFVFSRNPFGAGELHSVSAMGQGVPPRTAGSPSCGMVTIKSSLRAPGFSRKAAKLISRARRRSTSAVFEAHFSKFSRWCSQWSLVPFSATMAEVVYFLDGVLRKD